MSEVTPARHKLYWLPNALTVLRILLIPILVWGVITGDLDSSGIGLSIPFSIALGVFLVCAITDYIDGALARAFKVTSNFGRMLDPIADKLLVAACLIVFGIVSYGEYSILIPAMLIIGRDITVSGIREFAALESRVMAPTKLAKWKTAFEMLGIIIILTWLAIFNMDLMDGVIWGYNAEEYGVFNQVLLWLGVGVLWLAAILSVYTGFHYFRSAMKPKGA